MAEALRIGIAGLGTVGASVMRALSEKAAELTRQCGRELVVTGVSARTQGRDRGIDLGSAEWFDDPVKLAKSQSIDVFVELIGGEEGAARGSVKAALEASHHVVTANKALLARHGVALPIAEEGRAPQYEAAVAGSIPSSRPCAGRWPELVTRVFGILSGTCNYDPHKRRARSTPASMRSGSFAEADPTFDIEGTHRAQARS